MTMLYRGQPYGAPVGAWWTDRLDDAVQFAMSRGGGSYVVLGFDEDDPEWLAAHLQFPAGRERGNWYKVPLRALRARWHGVQVVQGAVRVPADGEGGSL